MAPPISSWYQPVGQECSCGKANLKEYACSEIATGATDSAMSSDEPFLLTEMSNARVVSRSPTKKERVQQLFLK